MPEHFNAQLRCFVVMEWCSDVIPLQVFERAVGERAFEVGQLVGGGGGEEVSARQVTPAQKIGAMLGVVQSVRRAEWLVERTDRSVQSRVMLQKNKA